MKILIVAPQSELEVQQEIVDAIGGDGDQTKVLSGSVSIRMFLDTVQTWRPDAIHFAGHGADSRILFEDGVIDASLVADAVRSIGGVKLCIFNSCESLNMALACYMAGAAYAIGWSDQVSNDVATSFAFTFWASWKMSGSVHGAFQTGRESVRYFPNHHMPSLLNGRGDAYTSQMKDLQREVDRLTRLTYWLSGLLVLSISFGFLNAVWLHI